MFALSIKRNIPTLIILFLLSFVNGQDRKLTPQLNPGCEGCTYEDTLVYVKAEGAHDIIHQIWDFTRGIPTVILAVAGLNSSLSVTWIGTEPKEFLFSETPKYSFAAAIDKLYEYDDIRDDGFMDHRCPNNTRSLSHMAWHRNTSVLTTHEIMVVMHGRFLYREPWRTDALEIKLDLLPYRDYAADLPHLIHTANSTLVDIALVDLSPTPAYNASRFAVHLTLVSTEAANDSMHSVITKTLDDEHTPGVFGIVELKTPQCIARAAGGFVQFRPVGYTQRAREVGSSTVAHVSPLERATVRELTPLRRFFPNITSMLAQDVVVSFGVPEDGYYKQHNYTSWSFTIGYGAPPAEGFSVFVIAVICTGLGVPVLLALSGALYATVRRCRQQTHSRQLLTNEE